MSASDLAFGRFVVWHGLRALIVDIQWHGRAARVQVQVAGGHTHWASPNELEAWDG
jgi:hypothetical protein